MPRKTFSSSGPNAEDRMMELFTNEMIAKLESLKGSTKWEKPWFSAAGLAWPKNMSGREYAGHNAILLKIMAEKNNYELPIWATFHRLTSLNYQKDPTKGPIPLRDSDGQDLPRVMVNKGEKSTPIGLTVFTVIHKDTKEKIPYEEYRELDAEEQKQYNVYPKTAVYNVFNVGQTNLKQARPEVWAKLAEFSRMPEQTRDEKGRFVIPEVEAMVKRQRFYCPINHVDKDACFYSISRDCVTMVPPEKFKSGEAYVNNLYHECSHALGKVGRLDRFTPEKMQQPNFQANEELTAELSAALLCSRWGLEKSIKGDSLPYLKSWLDSLHESPSYIRTVMNDVKKTSAMLIGRLEEVKQELEAEKQQGKENTAEVEDKKEVKVADKTPEVVAAKAVAPAPPKEEQEEHIYRGYHR